MVHVQDQCEENLDYYKWFILTVNHSNYWLLTTFPLQLIYLQFIWNIIGSYRLDKSITTPGN